MELSRWPGLHVLRDLHILSQHGEKAYEENPSDTHSSDGRLSEPS